MNKKQKNCQHDFKFNYDCFEDAKSEVGDLLWIPGKCFKCNIEGEMKYRYEGTIDKNNNTLE